MKSTSTHVTSPRKLSLPRRLGLLGRGSLLLGGGRASRLARTAVERGHLLLHVHLQLVLRGLRRHGRRLLRDRHHALLLGHVELHFLLLLLLLERQERLVTLLLELVLRHFDVARALRSDHLLLRAGLAVERRSRVRLALGQADTQLRETPRATR